MDYLSIFNRNCKSTRILVTQNWAYAGLYWLNVSTIEEEVPWNVFQSSVAQEPETKIYLSFVDWRL